LRNLKVLRLYFTFFQGFFLPAFLISLGGSAILFVWGMQAFMAVFWYKIVTMFVLYSFVKRYKKKEFFYYQNLGLSLLKLWSFALIIDMFLFITLIVVARKLVFFNLLLE
jgi:hypothetical protein